MIESTTTSLLSPAQLRLLRRQLLGWFRKAGRDLPWRKRHDAYAIWVSEVMLQQTQVRTVVPYFQRFMARFPTLSHLASADAGEVLRQWEGLGYYRRARNLHHAARIIAAEHGGIFPANAESAARLPGIGRYTLGAILSQAFDLRMPIVEANSERVLCRLFARTADPKSAAERRWLWQAANSILPRKSVGQFNQALMELGALVCTSGTPSCQACPLSGVCQARRLGLEASLPRQARRPDSKQVAEVAVVLWKKGKVFLVQRPAQGRWGELWEFPHHEVHHDEDDRASARAVVRKLTGFVSIAERPLITIQHTITHHRITLACYEARYKSGRFASSFYERGRWLLPHQLAEFPVSSPQRRLARFLIRPDGPRSLF